MIGYYVHHHGAGHRARAISIAAAAPGRFTLLGSGLDTQTCPTACINLPDDRASHDHNFAGLDQTETRPVSLHYAPIGHQGVRDRVSVLTHWIAVHRPSLMVVDVSVEIAVLARLAATPTVYVRLAGDRTDPAHLDAFRGAAAILAPFHPDLDDPATPDWVRAKTRYASGLGPVEPMTVIDETLVVVVFGSGGGQADGEALAAAARRTPELSWIILGPMSPIASSPVNLRALGWVEDAAAWISRAGLVIGSAGDGVVGAVLTADRPFICLPQVRPFDEQRSKAHRLAAHDAATLLEAWPEPDAWPDVLRRARRPVGAARRRLATGDDARAVARWITALASDLQTGSIRP